MVFIWQWQFNLLQSCTFFPWESNYNFLWQGYIRVNQPYITFINVFSEVLSNCRCAQHGHHFVLGSAGDATDDWSKLTTEKTTLPCWPAAFQILIVITWWFGILLKCSCYGYVKTHNHIFDITNTFSSSRGLQVLQMSTHFGTAALLHYIKCFNRTQTFFKKCWVYVPSIPV